MFPDTLIPGDIIARYWGEDKKDTVYYMVVSHCNRQMFEHLNSDEPPPDYLLVRLNAGMRDAYLEPVPSVTNMMGAKWLTPEGLKNHSFHYTGVNIAEVLKNIGEHVQTR